MNSAEGAHSVADPDIWLGDNLMCPSISHLFVHWKGRKSTAKLDGGGRWPASPHWSATEWSWRYSFTQFIDKQAMSRSFGPIGIICTFSIYKVSDKSFRDTAYGIQTITRKSSISVICGCFTDRYWWFTVCCSPVLYRQCIHLETCLPIGNMVIRTTIYPW